MLITLLQFSFHIRCKFAVLAILLSLPLISQAQWSIGVKGGFNLAYSNLVFEEDKENINHRSHLIGLALAIPVEYQTQGLFGVRTGLSYIQKGTRFNYLEAGPNQFFDTKYVIDYLEFPMIAKATFNFNRVNLYLLGGGHAAYAINMRVISLSLDPDVPVKETFQIEFEDAEISRLDLGLLFGGGIEAHIAEDRRIFVEMQYNLGLNDIDKSMTDDAFNEGRTFTMGMLIPLKKKKRK